MTISRSRIAIAIAVAASVLAVPAVAEVYVADKSHSEVGFQVRHLMAKVRGRFTDYDAKITGELTTPESARVEFTVKTASIDTDNESRDKHLRTADFFESEKFPEMTFRSTKITPRGKDLYDVAGTFTLRGVAKEVVLPVKYLGTLKDPGGREKLGFETEITLSRKDFGLVWNRALDNGGVLLGDDVWVSVNLQVAKPRPAAPAPSPSPAAPAPSPSPAAN